MGEKSKPIRQEPLHKGTCSGSIWVFHGILGSKQALRRSAKKLHAEGARKRDQLNREKGSRGTSSLFVCPLQGAGTAPLLGFGATPQLFLVRPIQKEKSTRRRQRSVPASNFALPQKRPPTCSFNLPHIVAPIGATDHPKTKINGRCREFLTPAVFLALVKPPDSAQTRPPSSRRRTAQSPCHTGLFRPPPLRCPCG